MVETQTHGLSSASDRSRSFGTDPACPPKPARRRERVCEPNGHARPSLLWSAAARRRFSSPPLARSSVGADPCVCPSSASAPDAVPACSPEPGRRRERVCESNGPDPPAATDFEFPSFQSRSFRAARLRSGGYRELPGTNGRPVGARTPDFRRVGTNSDAAEDEKKED